MAYSPARNEGRTLDETYARKIRKECKKERRKQASMHAHESSLCFIGPRLVRACPGVGGNTWGILLVPLAVLGEGWLVGARERRAGYSLVVPPIGMGRTQRPQIYRGLGRGPEDLSAGGEDPKTSVIGCARQPVSPDSGRKATPPLCRF